MIQLENFATAYGKGDAFTVEQAVFAEGQIHAIIGKNGSGKSTLLKAMAGLSPYRGSLLIDGKECHSYEGKERARHVAYLPQIVNRAVIDVRTLVEHGRYPYHGNVRRLSGEDLRKIEEALAITELLPLQHKTLTELSGGEMKRAYLAMVIAQSAPMILLDEPMAYIDQLHQKQFYDLLLALKERGHGIVMVCHELPPCFTVSDRIWLMREKKLLPGKTPKEWLAEDALLYESFGAAVKYDEDPELLYPYQMKRER